MLVARICPRGCVQPNCTNIEWDFRQSLKKPFCTLRRNTLSGGGGCGRGRGGAREFDTMNTE